MLIEFDERTKDYWSVAKGKLIVKLAQQESKRDDNRKANVMPLHLGAFVLSNSKKTMNNFVEAIGGIKNNDAFHKNTDSLLTKKSIGKN